MQWFRSSRAYEVVVSLLVFVILAAQIATLIPNAMGSRMGALFWPILTYGMYATSNTEGQQIDVYYLLEGELMNGTRINITRETLGLRTFDYIGLTRKLARSGDAETIALFKDLYRFDELRYLDVKTYPLKLAREGGVKTESELVNRVVLAGNPEARP